MPDPNFDRLIRGATQRRTSSVPCPDAETLAVFVEGGLDAAERRTIEGHAADCLHCGRQLAALARIEAAAADTVAPVRARSLIRRWAWLVPVATTVLVVAVWIRTPNRQADAPATRPPQSPVESRPSGSRMDGAREEPAAPANSGAAAEADAQQPAPRQVDEPTLRNKVKREAGLERYVAAPAELKSRADGDDKAPAKEDESRPSLGAMAQAPSTPARAMPTSAAAATAEGATALRKSADMTLRDNALAAQWTMVVTEQVRLRASGDRLERSVDAGASWTVELEGIGDRITAGSCPAADVCWVGGAGGTVLLRGADAAWSRRPLPVGARIGRIHAIDSLNATVFLADGRSFQTTDGGRTWAALP
jgi:hypothetical protein